MEPPKVEVIPVTVAYYTEVIRIERRTRRIYTGGFGDTAKFVEEDMGWWLVMKDSFESVYVGKENPGFIQGDKIKVTFEKR